MKPIHILSLITTLGLIFEIKGQSFELPIYFKDAVGYEDTIIVGYDINGSYGIDTALGEIDILDSAYSKPLEARAAIYDYNSESPRLQRIIESKKMIIGYVCFDPFYFDEANSIMLVIKTDNWPVTISWDKTLFHETCNGLDIVDCTPGGWFDVCGAGHPYQVLGMPLIDTASYFDSEFHIETSEDTLRALFLRFYKFGTGTEDALSNNIKVTPNPIQSTFQLNYPLSTADKLTITDLIGKPVPFTYYNQQIELIDAPNGMYIISIQLKSNKVISKIVVKQSS